MSEVRDVAERQDRADATYFQINYAAASKGPYDTGTTEFKAFVGDSAMRYNKAVTDSVKGKSPF